MGGVKARFLLVSSLANHSSSLFTSAANLCASKTAAKNISFANTLTCKDNPSGGSFM